MIRVGGGKTGRFGRNIISIMGKYQKPSKSLSTQLAPRYASGKIVFSYVAWLICIFFLSIYLLGRDTVLKSSVENGKPYAMLFSPLDLNTPDESNSLKVIGLGDSTFFAPAYGGDSHFGRPEDHIPAILDRTLESYEPTLEVVVSSWAFGGANMYNYYCMFYKAEKLSPDLIIIPINWTSFGAWWRNTVKDNFPELCAFAPLSDDLISDHENLIVSRNIVSLKQLEYKIRIWSVYPYGMKQWVLAALRDFSDWGSEEESEEDGDKSEGWREQMDKSAVKGLYNMKVNRPDKSYRGIRAVANLASKHGVKTLFYITPLNLEFMDRKGALNRKVYEASRDLLIEATRAEGVYCIDLSDLLADEYFPDPTQHCNLEGRKKICEALAPVVLDILKREPSASTIGAGQNNNIRQTPRDFGSWARIGQTAQNGAAHKPR